MLQNTVEAVVFQQCGKRKKLLISGVSAMRKNCEKLLNSGVSAMGEKCENLWNSGVSAMGKTVKNC
jgi:hypothetical protein